MNNRALLHLLLPIALAGVIHSRFVLAQDLYFPPAGSAWESVDPELAGFDAAALDQAMDVAGERNSSGVVILHNGRLVIERYWTLSNPPPAYANVLQGNDEAGHAIEDVASAQKSVAAILAGIAVQKGLLELEAPVSRYLGSGWSGATIEQESDINLLHLLTMTSGLDTSLGFDAPAGSRWLYNTPAYHFLMRAVEAAADLERNVLTREWLTGPLGMTNTRWVPRPWADANIGVGLATTARELARFGLLVLAQGHWQDQVIVENQAFFHDMLDSSQALNPSYGYLWWLNGKEFSLSAGPRAARNEGSMIPSAPADLVAMQGAQDRKLYVVPSLGLVIARLGSDGARDGMDFNSAFWEALMQARTSQEHR